MIRKDTRVVRANIMSVIILGAVFLAPLGFLSGSNELQWLGKSTMVSPLPIPFRDSNGFENYLYKSDFVIVTTSGEVLRMNTAAFLAQADFTGPHMRKVPYLVFVSWMPRLPDTIRRPLFEIAFCQQPVLGYTIDSLTIELENRRTGVVDFASIERCYE